MPAGEWPSGMVRDLLVALDQSDTIALQDALDRLSRHGDTSGMDCALGVVLALIVSPTRATRDR